MKYKRFTIIIITILVYSCSTNNNNIEIVKLQLLQELYSFDSIYFSRIHDIESYNGKLFMLGETSSEAVISIDSLYRLHNIFGAYGHGPGEFVDPRSMVIKDSTIFIADAGKIQLITYGINGEYINEQRLTDRYYSMNVFSTDNEKNLYFNTPNDPRMIHIVDATGRNLKNIEIQNIELNNERDNQFHIIKHGSILVSVSVTSPQINIYDSLGESKIIFMPDYLVESRLKYKEQKIRENPDNVNRVYILNYDVYCHQDKLFILFTENESNGEFRCNKILVVEDIDNSPSFAYVLELYGNVYESICINSNGLIAYEQVKNTVEFYQLDH